MDISMNIDDIISNNLTMNEYLYLRNLFVGAEDKIKDLYKIIEHINEDSLQERGFIKITSTAIILRQKALDLFEKKELFYKFLATYPIKTPTGRYLSPAGTEGKAVEDLQKKWNRLFKNKQNKELKAIEVLNAEIAWRKKANQLEYMNAAEAWLNQANYEKYEYLLDLNKSDTNTEKWI